jgi:hypothetical protein
MTVVLTTAGSAYLADILAGTSPSNTFDALELGQGNNVPAIGDTRAALTSKIGGSLVQVAPGYPVLGDADIRNEGRGTSIYTWSFVYPEGIQAIASNFIVTNYAAGAPGSGEPVMVSASQALAKRSDQVMTVFVNLSTAGATSVSAHVEDGEPLVEQLQNWRDQSISLSGAPGAHPVSSGKVTSQVNEDERVWTAARILNGTGGVLTREDVVSITLYGLKRTGEREWTRAYESPLSVADVVPTAPVRTDARWRGVQGYNFAHSWIPDQGWGSRKTRLEYHLELTSGESKTLVHEVEWISVRTR